MKTFNEQYEQLIVNACKELEDRLDMTVSYTDSEFLIIIEECVIRAAAEKYIETSIKKKAVTQLFNERRRLDILQPLLDDTEVDEIMVNGKDMIFTERRGVLKREDISFKSESKLFDIIQTIVSRVNRTINELNPIVDARLPDGSRVNVALPPVALNGPILTIRKFKNCSFNMKELIKLEFISEEAADFLIKSVLDRKNIFISGGTGSGKTTFLNVLAGFVPVNERVVTIEDSAELRINGIENIVRLEARNQTTGGVDAISVRDLLKAALRMRPDRIIVGEIRSAEALDMLQAMNTGHDGSLSTGHANSTVDMILRIETMAMYAGVLPLEAIKKQIASAVDLLVHLNRMGDATRKVLEISKVAGYDNGNIIIEKIFELSGDKLMKVGVA